MTSLLCLYDVNTPGVCTIKLCICNLRYTEKFCSLSYLNAKDTKAWTTTHAYYGMCTVRISNVLLTCSAGTWLTFS